MNIKTARKGFTLIELLVVIAIIGVLASVVLASLNTARRKSRDARRVADIKQIQLALEMYFDSNEEYPENVADLATTYLPTEPKDPSTAASYPYDNYESSAGAACDAAATAGTCLFYHIGTLLEDTANTGLASDRDLEIGSKTAGTAPDGVSNSAACASAATAAADDRCYDATP